MKKQPRPLQRKVIDEAIALMKQSTDPIVIDASVGAGKSLLQAEIAAHVSGRNGRVLCLARQGELVDQNSTEALDQGLKNSIYSASLNLKSTHYPVIYGTEGSVYRALDTDFADLKIDLMLIDECHTCPFDNEDTMMMKIIRRLLERNPKMRICGLTGSPYRGQTSIIGPFWKRKTETDMSTSTLVEHGYLLESHFGFPDSETEEIDFSQFELKGDHNGNDYSEDEINRIYQGSVEKTFAICADIVNKTRESNGVLIFAGSKLHTEQVRHGLELAGVTRDKIRIVTDDTGNKDRLEARKAAIEGRCRFFINIAVASTGWNVPRWDTVVYLRPVGSLVFLTQSIGRGLRPLLSADEAAAFNSADATTEDRKAILADSQKPYCMVYDYAGVMERLGHLYNSPLLEQAELERAKREGETIECPDCGTENSEHARRCIGVSLTSRDGRCEFFWQCQECRICGTKNDVTAQECRHCRAMLRDPANALLNKAYTDAELTRVHKMECVATKNGGLLVKYIVADPHEDKGHPAEFFGLTSDAGKRIFYNKFLKLHLQDPQWRGRARGMTAQALMKNSAMFDVPTHIAWRLNDKGYFVIGKKLFRSGRVEDADTAA